MIKCRNLFSELFIGFEENLILFDLLLFDFIFNSCQ